jgi:hypothetical protein
MRRLDREVSCDGPQQKLLPLPFERIQYPNSTSHNEAEIEFLLDASEWWLPMSMSRGKKRHVGKDGYETTCLNYLSCTTNNSYKKLLIQIIMH